MSQNTPTPDDKADAPSAAQAESAAQASGETSPGQPAAAAGTAAAAAALPFYRRPLFWSLLLLVLLAALIGWLLYRQWEAARALEAEQQAALSAAREKNDALEAYLQSLRDLLKEDPCVVKEKLPTLPPPPAGVDGTPLMIPDDAASAADPKQPAAPAAPKQPLSPVQPPKQEVTPTTKADSMALLLEQGTVLVLAQQSRGLSMGSGFFISQRHIVSNGHVVGDASLALVTNKATGKVLKARILHRIEEGGYDFSVLELEQPAPITPLTFCFSVQRTERVSAWGFPGAVTGDDPKFKALLEGDAASVPEVVYSDGSVNVVQERDPALIVHSATVSQGNSGGPLVNQAGQVVGINTFIKLDGESYRQSSIAVVSSEVARFLQQWKIPYLEAKASAPAGSADQGKGAASAAPAPSGASSKPAPGKASEAAPKQETPPASAATAPKGV
ncbi:serine protease [uncultured Desulfovibrio sp.]|uniref:Serine protease n=1 Tax=Candidatus Desulfovibrio intestinavium TaxID=2838534 RepID=A0A9D2HJM7_9BACT|nr:serine protease [uncultured Desulfovibrio sp.]HJA78155.1 serine protease [Candidatus Desulfovibrio intestinavium]